MLYYISMLYFSELKNKKVYTEDNISFGKLKDIIFLALDTPTVTKLVVKTKSEDDLIIPLKYLVKMNGGITVGKNFQETKLDENELYLGDNLLDNQIIDISGSKIVRVNDVVIQDKPGYYVAGVDIGLLGILRWFGLEDYLLRLLGRLGIKITSNFLSWGDVHPLELTRGHVKIKKEQTKLDKIRPEDLADYLERTNTSNINRVLKIMDEKTATDVINNLSINYQTSLFKQFTSEKAAKILANMDSEEGVDILLTLSKKKREKIMSFLDDKTFKEIEYLLSLSKTPIGNILTTEFLTVESTDRAKEVIANIKRETHDFYTLNDIYVVNKDQQLVGVFDLHELLLQKAETRVYKFMNQNLSMIYLSTPEIVALRKIVKYKINNLPVVDKDKHLLGVVRFDDVIDLFLSQYE